MTRHLSPSRVHQWAQQVAGTICGQTADSGLEVSVLLAQREVTKYNTIEIQTNHRDVMSSSKACATVACISSRDIIVGRDERPS